MKSYRNILVAMILGIVTLLSGVTMSILPNDIFNSSSNEINKDINLEKPEDTSAATAPSNTSGYWTDEGRYSTSWSGSGTESDPYLISTAQQLAGLSYMVYSGTGPVTDTYYFYKNTYFKQTANIDLSAYYWNPIGIGAKRSGSSTRRYFSGTYDGGAHTVSGVFTPAGSTSDYDNQGLFGLVGGAIKNVGVINSYIQGHTRVGGVVGEAYNNAVISNCYNAGVVSGVGISLGGVVGILTDSSTINYCYNTGNIEGNTAVLVGGVVGYLTVSGTATNCYNTGEVKGGVLQVGGVFGAVDNTSKATNCYNTGSVNGGDEDTGGIAGYVSSSTLTNCYNTGSINGKKYVGGVVGNPKTSTTIANCYNTGSVTGTMYYAGVVGKTGATTITKCYFGGDCALQSGEPSLSIDRTTKIASLNSTSYAKNKTWYTTTSNWDSSYPWDFTNVWKIDSSKNDGYPIFIPKTAIITANAGAGISSVSGSGEYNIGSTATVTASVSTGYTFQKWTTSNSASAAAVSTSATYSFTVSSATTLYAWATLNKYSVNLNALAPDGSEGNSEVSAGYGYAYFDMTVSDTAGNYSGTYTSITNEPSWLSDTGLGYGSTITISNIQSHITGKYNLSSVSSTGGVQNTSGYTFVVNGSGTITIQMEWIEYYLDVNGNLDGTVLGNLSGYATFDVYIDGVKVGSNVSDYCIRTHHYGQTYEIKNIQCLNDKAYVGVYAENGCTTVSSLSGTITGDRVACLKFRTKTWEDYAASSYAGGNGTQSNPYIIKTPEQLGLLAKQGQTQELTAHYKLGASIDLSAHEWKPIGIGQTYRLCGTFDGDMYCISNMKTTFYYDHAGLFATIYNTGIVKNLIIKNATVLQGNWTGAISGLVDNGGTVTNCIVEDANLKGTSVGGITGWSWNSNIISNVVRGCTITATKGGTIMGSASGSGGSVIKDNGTYSNTLKVDRSQGGIYGVMESTAYKITGCYASYNVNGTQNILMWGDSSAWGNWIYSTNLNGGYPVQKTLFTIGGITGSANVYNYLKNTLGFASV